MYKHKIYFLIGCPRTGSTYLHNILKHIKKINLLPKENHFFLSKNVFKRNYFYKTPNYQLKTSISHYLNKLDFKKINYDINTLYFYDLKALKTIKKIFPNSSFFCFLRDPIKRHFSMSLNNIKKYYLYKSTGDFKFPISDFCDLKKSWVFNNEMLSYSNYFYHKKILKQNKIKYKYYYYENLFLKKKNYNNFLKDIEIKKFDKKIIYAKHSQLDYPYKFNNDSFRERAKNFIFKNHYKKEINKTLFEFKKNYPTEIMKKTFSKKTKNLRKVYLSLIN